MNILTAYQQIEQLLPMLTQDEKARLLQEIAHEIGRNVSGIEQNSAVNGGDPSIIRTRIPVWLLVQARRAGASDTELLTQFPMLRAEDLSNAWTYYAAHRDEIEAQILLNESA